MALRLKAFFFISKCVNQYNTKATPCFHPFSEFEGKEKKKKNIFQGLK
jgi:hypothetical protein